MSRNIKYLGSNCKPVIAETVESNQTNQTQSRKEHQMTVNMNSTSTPSEALVISVAAADLQPGEVAKVNDTVKTNVEAALNPIKEEKKEMQQVNEIPAAPAADKLKEASVAKAAKAAAGIDWWNLAACGVIAGTSVGSRMVLENVIEEDEEAKPNSALEIAGRVVASATLAAGVGLLVQKVTPASISNEYTGAMTATLIGNSVGIADAMFGDSLIEMMSKGSEKVTESVTAFFDKEEAAE